MMDAQPLTFILASLVAACLFLSVSAARRARASSPPRAPVEAHAAAASVPATSARNTKARGCGLS